MSKIKNGGLDQYGAEPFKQQQFGTAGVEGVNPGLLRDIFLLVHCQIQEFSAIYINNKRTNSVRKFPGISGVLDSLHSDTS